MEVYQGRSSFRICEAHRHSISSDMSSAASRIFSYFPTKLRGEMRYCREMPEFHCVMQAEFDTVLYAIGTAGPFQVRKRGTI